MLTCLTFWMYDNYVAHVGFSRAPVATAGREWEMCILQLTGITSL